MSGPAEASEAEKDREVAVDVKHRAHDEEGSSETERVCRICHLAPDHDGDGEEEEVAAAEELIHLGCACKGELGSAHRQCAEAWFRARGNRYCEICGSNAKNVNGEEDDGFMEEWHARTTGMNRGSSPDRGSYWRNQPMCNMFVATLVIAFMILWFVRVNLP